VLGEQLNDAIITTRRSCSQSIVLLVTVTVTMISTIVVWGIFSRSNEVNWTVTRVVFVTVLAPVLRMSRRYV